MRAERGHPLPRSPALPSPPGPHPALVPGEALRRQRGPRESRPQGQRKVPTLPCPPGTLVTRTPRPAPPRAHVCTPSRDLGGPQGLRWPRPLMGREGGQTECPASTGQERRVTRRQSPQAPPSVPSWDPNFPEVSGPSVPSLHAASFHPGHQGHGAPQADGGGQKQGDRPEQIPRRLAPGSWVLRPRRG